MTRGARRLSSGMGRRTLRNLWFPLLATAIVWLFAAALNETTLPRADLVVANGPDPRSLDPAVTTAIADARVLSSLFEGLLDMDPVTLEPVPALARALPTCSDDGLTWTFELRPGLVWSDGEPLDAHGLRWSFLRFLDPSTAARFTELMFGVRGARDYNATGAGRDAVGIVAPDAATLVFHLERPQPYFPSILTLFPLYPVPRHAVERHGADWVTPELMVCNGAFKPAFWRLRDRIRVKKNPRYREAEQVRLETIDWLSVESGATMLNLYVNDDCDVITDVPTSAVPELRRRFGPDTTGEFVPTARLGTFFFRVNTTRKPFSNPKIRRALSLAIDRESIVENVTRAGEAAAASLVPPGTLCGGVAYSPPLVCTYDPEQARRLLTEGLEEEGLGDGDLPVFEVLYSPDVNDQVIAEVLQQQWKKIGARCRLVNMDSKAIRSAIRQKDYTVGRSSWIGDFNDPSNFLDLFLTSGGDGSGFSDVTYDADVGDRASKAASATERAAILASAERRLLEQAPIIPIYHYVSRAMVKPWVKGFHRNVLDWHPPRWLRVER